jgi:chemotaxis protein MotB
MGRQKNIVEEEEMAGAPEWMVTFSDCMTLLLTFFVLLLSFSSFDNKVFRRLKVIYSTALTSITPTRYSNRDAFTHIPPVKYEYELDKGSEKPTLLSKPLDGLMNEQEHTNFQKGIVFLMPSNTLFWGKGNVISSEGRSFLDKMAIFLKEVNNHIVISESNLTNNQDAEYKSLQRSWSIMNYLIYHHNIDNNRLSISMTSTLSTEMKNNIDSYPDMSNGENRVEISLMEWSIYN